MSNNKKSGEVDIKVVMLGDSGVGKTSLLVRFLDNTFGNTRSTIGASFFKKSIPSKSGKGSIELGLWDTAGQERYDSLSSFYCRHTNVALICYNVTEESTFQNIQKWYHKLETSVPAEDCFVILVGTKSDLGKSVITEKKVEDLISNNRLIFKHFVTSAKDGTNVSTIFDTIAEEYERRKANNQNKRASLGMVPISQLQTNGDTSSSKKGCCG